MEEWRDVVGYEGYYEVSSLGRVRSVQRVVDCGCRGMRRLPTRLLKQVDIGGYLTVQLNRDRATFKALIHRLVCIAWHGPPPSEKHQVAHGDGSRKNNKPDNLRWVTAAENAADRRAHGRTAEGQRNWNTKLNPQLVREIRRRALNGEAFVELAKMAKCSATNIRHIVNRRIWKHVE